MTSFLLHDVLLLFLIITFFFSLSWQESKHMDLNCILGLNIQNNFPRDFIICLTAINLRTVKLSTFRFANKLTLNVAYLDLWINTVHTKTVPLSISVFTCNQGTPRPPPRVYAASTAVIPGPLSHKSIAAVRGQVPQNDFVELTKLNVGGHIDTASTGRLQSPYTAPFVVISTHCIPPRGVDKNYTI